MSVTEGQRHYLKTSLALLVILQGVMLLYLSYSEKVVCNSFSAWPLNFTGSFFITGFTTLIIAIFFWRRLSQNALWQEAVALGVLTAVGVSHTVERASSGCVLDYWPLPVVNHVYFNLGDLSLTLVVLGYIYWYGFVSKQ
jgi:lipoprotein signal peptidase